MDGSLKILTLCTGNVARSVMLGYMLTTLAEASGETWQIRTAGTLVVEGSAMSSRTRDALVGLGELGEHRYGAHRSHHVTAEDVAWADVVLTSEADHVNFVRVRFPSHATKAVQLHQFVRFAPLDESFDEQLRAVSSMAPDPDFDVADPAGGDGAAYAACAHELWDLAQAFATLVGRDDLN